MSLLVSRFRSEVSKLKDYNMKVETEANVGYSSGFLNFDFMNGIIVNAKDNTGKPFQYYSIGITDGSMVMVIGRSGCGKTTWVVQASANIVRKYPNSAIFHDDIEGGITESRKLALTGFTPEELSTRYIHRNTGINAENFYERNKLIKDTKLADRASYEYDTGLYDEMGNRIFKLMPTVYILDSLALLMPGKLTDEEELSGQMSATAIAKTNAAIFKRIVPMLKAANIILIVINHINQNVDINPMAKKKAQVSYLKQDETLPGGNMPIYLSNIMLKFVDHNKLSDDEAFGINGTLVDIEIIKSRVARAGQKTTLVFNQEKGFDPELSMLIMLKEHGRVNGAGAYLYLGDRNDIKFSQKKFKELLATNKEFQQVFSDECFSVLNEIIKESYVITEEEKANSFSVADNLLSRIAC